MQLRYSIAALTSAVALMVSVPATVGAQMHPHRDGRLHYDDIYGHGRGPRYGQYGPPDDGPRGFYGHRGDDRWRYYDGARPANAFGPYWLGGPPYDSPIW